MQPSPPDHNFDVDAIDRTIAEHSFTGVVAIDVGDERVFERANGLAVRAYGIANTAQTKFAVASGAKFFTALVVMDCVERGLLALDTPVRNLLGADLALIDDRVTIEHLLRHTSGIGDYLDEDGGWEVTDYVATVALHTLAVTDGFLPMLDGHPQVAPPGDRFAYCNGGFVVLALLAERASGQAYHDLVDQVVCARAALANTAFLRTDNLPGDAAIGYPFADSDRTNVLHMPVRGNGDGGVFTTVADMHCLWRRFVAGDIVALDTVAAMTAARPVPDDWKQYGLGLWRRPDSPSLMLLGYDAGVSFASIHHPANQATITIMANTSEGAWPLFTLLNGALG